jgi:hypothetical protein
MHPKTVNRKRRVMFKRYLSLLLVILVINLTCGASIFAAGKEDKEIRFAEKIKTNIAKLGTGKPALVKLKLKDKNKLEGYISAAGERTFTVTDVKTGAPSVVEYTQVKSAKGNNLSTGAKIAIGVGIAAAVIIFLVYYVKVVENDD